MRLPARSKVAHRSFSQLTVFRPRGSGSHTAYVRHTEQSRRNKPSGSQTFHDQGSQLWVSAREIYAVPASSLWHESRLGRWQRGASGLLLMVVGIVAAVVFIAASPPPIRGAAGILCLGSAAFGLGMSLSAAGPRFLQFATKAGDKLGVGVDYILSFLIPLLAAAGVAVGIAFVFVPRPTSPNVDDEFYIWLAFALFLVSLEVLCAFLQQALVPPLVRCRHHTNAMSNVRRATTSALASVAGCAVTLALVAAVLMPTSLAAVPISVTVAVSIALFRWQFARPRALDQIRFELLRQARQSVRATADLYASLTSPAGQIQSKRTIACRDIDDLLDMFRRFSGSQSRSLADQGVQTALEAVSLTLPHPSDLPLQVIRVLPDPLRELASISSETRIKQTQDFLSDLTSHLQGPGMLTTAINGRRAASHGEGNTARHETVAE